MDKPDIKEVTLRPHAPWYNVNEKSYLGLLESSKVLQHRLKDGVALGRDSGKCEESCIDTKLISI